MRKKNTNKISKIRYIQTAIVLCLFLGINSNLIGQVKLESEVQISDKALFFDGDKVNSAEVTNNGDNAPYAHRYGRIISPHGDCIKTYKEFVFMTWYRGDKSDRHMMLTRYNTVTGTKATIEFPHRHTGFLNKWWIGESHNTIAVGVSPLDGSIHLLYDMHSYDKFGHGRAFANDYFRYAYSEKNVASIADEEFTLDKFVKDPSDNDYTHLSLNGVEDHDSFADMTYPTFFLNDSGDLFMYMRQGGNINGAYKFSKYVASTSTWTDFTHINTLDASTKGETHDWGLYGDIKYANGKIRIAFQRRLDNHEDQYEYQNGVYYAYSDSQSGADGWKNHKGEDLTLPIVKAESVKIFEPGELVKSTAKDKVKITGGFDWIVTANGDEHIISQVQDKEFNETKNIHTYRKGGDVTKEFITTTDFVGASTLYTSGGDIFIIGLKNQRVFVERAKGGTNNFVRVYEATSGKRFNHGRVHIADGKLYYYLMERKTGSAQPTYLQTIDLDIDSELAPFHVALLSPTKGQKFRTGDEVEFRANAFFNDGSITKVDFNVNGVLYQEATTAPYAVNWIPEEGGNFVIEAVAYNSADEVISSKQVTVNVTVREKTDLTGDFYRLKNVGTGRYMDSENDKVITSASGKGLDKEWSFVRSGSFYNIDSRTDKGVLRAAGTPVGTVINTGKNAPTTDADKQWTVIYIEEDNTYRFQAKNGVNRFLYNDENDNVIYSSLEDDRSKWSAELISNALSINTNELVENTVKIYPNPAKTNFTIALNKLGKVDVIIHDVVGKVVYSSSTNQERLQIDNNGEFNTGVYFVKVVNQNNKVFHKKLVIR